MKEKKCKKCEEEISKLTKELEEKTKELEAVTEQAKRAAADLMNYRRRVEEDQKNFVMFANSTLILELLPILDNFERAIKQMPPDNEQIKDFGKGIIQIYDHFRTVIQKSGLSEIKIEIGQKFDTNFHEAMLSGPGEKDTILEELEKGYMLGGKVLRPAKVKVGIGA